MSTEVPVGDHLMSPPQKKQRTHSSHSSASRVSDSDSDKQTYTISQTLVDALIAKGFSENAIKKSIVGGCIDLSTCTQWIKMQEGHPDLNTPLEDGVVVNIKVSSVLTEEERDAKVKELKERVKQHKEEEKEELHRKERERLEMMRNMAHVQHELTEVRRKKEAEEARREKAADIEARRRVKIQIAADRLERQGHQREEAYVMAEKELEEAAERGRVKAAERLAQLQAPSVSLATSGATGEWNLSALTAAASAEARLDALFATDIPIDPAALVAGMREHNAAGVGAGCAATLKMILQNIIMDPLDMKKRTFRVSTRVFQETLLQVEEALEVLRWCGFDLASDATGGRTFCLSTVILRRLRFALTLLG